MPFDAHARFPRAPLDAPPPATHGEPPSRATFPPIDEGALFDELRRREAEALTRVPHVRQAIRTAEALVEPPLGRFPDLHAEMERDEWGRERLSYFTRVGVFLFVAAGSFVTAWLFIQMGVAVWEAMERAAAEAMARGPY